MRVLLLKTRKHSGKMLMGERGQSDPITQWAASPGTIVISLLLESSKSKLDDSVIVIAHGHCHLS